MHTLLPFDDFKITAICLSSDHLIRQANDCIAILDRIHEINGLTDWTDKTVQAWRGHELQLCEFGLECCDTLRRRLKSTSAEGDGHLETALLRHLELAEGGDMTLPEWFGDDDVHLEYKGLLIHMDPERYQPMWPSVAPCSPKNFRYPQEIRRAKSL